MREIAALLLLLLLFGGTAATSLTSTLPHRLIQTGPASASLLFPLPPHTHSLSSLLFDVDAALESALSKYGSGLLGLLGKSQLPSGCGTRPWTRTSGSSIQSSVQLIPRTLNPQIQLPTHTHAHVRT
ncbi:hypothetical protein B0I35DRAFT_74415 [Stachybotrys elegans]|uniref:Uncharacterized protein n=1 Tax=Stachybotrys elegans TaxID=80388 RepID=A0A8K0SEW7_9HYPO|nr:hypothetical protein B0I35DRAFT_74415 [Stachybotrys elegans]